MIELHPDWLDRMSATLNASGRRQGEWHARQLREIGALPGNTARDLLGWIDAGDLDILAFFIPRPVALSSTKSWSRQYWRARESTGLPREQTPPLGYISQDDERKLRASYVDGVASAFYETLARSVNRDPAAASEETQARLVSYLDPW